MKKIIWSMVIGLLLIAGLNIDEAVAQSPPNIKVSLAFNPLKSRLQNRLLYLAGDPVEIVLTLGNSAEEITRKGFSSLPFQLFLTFVDPDGRGIISKDFENTVTQDPPPPFVIPVEVSPGRVELLQSEPVERLNAAWVLTVTLPNAHAYYSLPKPGNYSVKAIIPMRTYLSIDHTVDGVDYSEIDRFKWKGAIESNTVNFTILADADGDGYYVPEGWPPGAPPDCNDSDPNEHPNQIWYKDADNDGYSDGTTITSCTRPQGYKVASELIALSGDCDDNNPNVNPGMKEIPCNGVDDDCNPATPDVPAPTLASPANGATNVSTTPTLSWNAVRATSYESQGAKDSSSPLIAVSCATNYGLQVAKNSSFSTSSIVVNQSGITSTSYTLASPLSNNTTYYWRVNGKNAGETSPWSEIRSFTTAKQTYLLTVTKSGTGSGNVTVSPGTLTWNGNVGTASYDPNTTVTLTATPNAGSTFTGWSAFCSGSGNCSVMINGSKCTLKMCGPCNTTVTFTIQTYTITATAGPNGSISPSGAVKVNYGADKTFTIKPNTGYQIADVKVDNVSKGAVSTYTFKNVTANHTISATFKR